MTSQTSGPNCTRPRRRGLWLATISVALGVAMGVATNNLALWLPLGIIAAVLFRGGGT